MDKEKVLKVCNQIADKGLLKTLEIKFTDVGDDFLTATMPVNEKVYQPDGILHGGATVALAETVGSAAVAVLTKNSNLTIRGIEINANHKETKQDFIRYEKLEIIRKQFQQSMRNITENQGGTKENSGTS